MKLFEVRNWLVVAVVIGSGCGNRVDNLGVLVNAVGVTKEAIRMSPPEAPGRDLLPGTFRTRRIGDLLGDDRPETIVESDRRKSLEVESEDGTVTSAPFADYIADFAVVPEAAGAKAGLVVHTYPNAQGGSTFTLVDLSVERRLASWDENPHASRGVQAGRWKGIVAIFYLVNDDVVIRGVGGEPLARLTLQGATAFAMIQTVPIQGERTALLLSGDGYTPYHAVAILDRDGAILFHEQAPEHAFSLTSDGGHTFEVEARSQVWRYSLSRQ